jgi:predicted HAD superfamily phosphohydrolase
MMDMLLTLDDLARCSDDELYALHDEVFFRLVRGDLGAFARSLAIGCLDNIKIVLHSRATMRYGYAPAAAR